MINPPKRSIFPNWKSHPILTWLNYIPALVWLLGLEFLVGEMNIVFKGRHKDKKLITYKADGGGFQADALCQEGFTYQVYIRNDPVPSKYLRQGFSPFHLRVVSVFGYVKDDHYQFAMENLYNSAYFFRVSYNHDERLLCHGVTRKGGNGISE